MSNITCSKFHTWPYNFLFKILEHSKVMEMDIDTANHIVDEILKDPRKKDMIVMRYNDKMTYKKIGEKFEITSVAVREYEYRIIKNSQNTDVIKNIMIQKYTNPKDIPLAYTSLSLRECRALNRNRLYTIGDLLIHDKNSIRKLQGVGPMIIGHVTYILSKYGLSLKESE